MASKNKKRRPPKRRKRPGEAAAKTDRLQQRAMRMTPRAAKGECIEDVAVFDDVTRKSLSKEMADQVSAVRDALAAVAEKNDVRATQLLRLIPRKSPYSQWRLLVRGLIDWYADNPSKADESFSRLDPSRRPFRIAESLVAAKSHRLEGSGGVPGAGFVRTWLIERPSLGEARQIARMKESVPPRLKGEIRVGPERLEALIRFFKDHRSFEPELVAALERELIDRLFQMPFADLYEAGIESIPGPPHDPSHFLRSHVYYSKFEDGGGQAERLLDRYLTKELPKNKQLSTSMRGALAARLYFDRATEARAMLAGMPFAAVAFNSFDDSNDRLQERVDKSLQMAVSRYPAFEKAHQERVKWIREQLDDRRLSKESLALWESDLTNAMVEWSEGVPESVEPRLWLADHYLEKEQLDDAQPHVDWLGRSRHPNPRVRATPWKWSLLEAMRLCRRKVWLGQVDQHLDQADGDWPTWVRKDWLGYLRAALALRQGNLTNYEKIRVDARSASLEGGSQHADLADAVMMLGAAQRMRVPAADLKPLRVPVDAAAKSASELSNEALLLAGAFFCDLHRTGLLYPAYRMHGGKFADELLSRIQTTPRAKKVLVAESPKWLAMQWLSQRKMFSETYEINFPIGLRKAGRAIDPDMTAALELQAIVDISRLFRVPDGYKSLVSQVRSAADKQADPFLRRWYNSLITQGEEKVADANDWSFGAGGPLGGVMGGIFEAIDEDDALDDEFDDDDFDLECDCDHCTRRREQLGIAHPWEDGEVLENDDNPIGSDRPTIRTDPPEMPIDITVGQPSLFPELELPPETRSRPKPKFTADPEARRSRPKNPMKKKRKSK